MTGFSFTTTRQIICEPGSSSQTGSVANSLGVRHILVVTDASICDIGLHQAAVSSLEKAGVAVTVFSGVQADPPESIVFDALKLAKQSGVDGVLGFGGGSSMDVAKVVALLAKSGESLEAIYGVGNAKGARLPLIQVPTTAGTGSEVTPIAIITTGETTKQGIVAPQLLPDAAILDAELTLGLPPFPTATTGIDAMVHAIEAFTSRHKKNPYSDMLAKEALRLLAANVEQAVGNGSNVEARSDMLLGSLLAGQAFANAPVAAVHALAYPLGGFYHLAHGLTNALVLPCVLEFNASEADALYTELAGIVSPGTTPGTASLVAKLRELTAVCGLPTRLRDVEIPEADLPMLAKDSMQHQRLLVNNPRDVTEQDALAIYRAAY
jgi:alcohol dehydrogenase